MNQIPESQGLAPAPINLNDIDLELGALSSRENVIINSNISDIDNDQEDIEDFE